MTTITLEIPDDLALRLAPVRERLPKLLSAALELLPADEAATPHAFSSVFDEMIAFLASRPLPEQILAFKISAASQQRLAELLDKNREAGLTEDENAELDSYEQVHHTMLLLKARARQANPN